VPIYTWPVTQWPCHNRRLKQKLHKCYTNVTKMFTCVTFKVCPCALTSGACIKKKHAFPRTSVGQSVVFGLKGRWFNGRWKFDKIGHVTWTFINILVTLTVQHFTKICLSTKAKKCARPFRLRALNPQPTLRGFESQSNTNTPRNN
jgi:hypothetical protein